jgi:hypothetical protein
MMWHAHVVVWHGGRRMSSGVMPPMKQQGVVVMREGGWQGGSIDSGGGVSWQSRCVMSGSTAMLSMIIEY